jgi:hypothetical protein
MIHHPLSVAGLLLNTIGGLLLLFCPANPMTVTLDGAVSPVAYKNLHPTVRRRYLRQRIGFTAGMAGLILGFILQLIDLLCA